MTQAAGLTSPHAGTDASAGGEARGVLPCILIVAAEAREFAGVLQRIPTQPIAWPQAKFARQATLNGRHVIFLANGPGPRVVHQMLPPEPPERVTEVISTGFCGALDPSLKVGDIVEATPDQIWSEDRVVVTAEEKRRLWEKTGARVVEMEYAAVAAAANKWGVPCRAVRVVSDTAQEDLPLDLNRYRDEEGRFRLAGIALAGLLRPFSVLPGLMRLDRNAKMAADKLGAFFANSQF